MYLNPITRAFGRRTRQRLSRLRTKLAPWLAVSIAAAVTTTAHAQRATPASLSACPTADRNADRIAPVPAACDPTLMRVKFLPQHNSRPAPPPNRTSFTKPPAHHA